MIQKLVPLMFILVACSTGKKNSTTTAEKSTQMIYMQEHFDKQGHRGCRGLMPENTVPAMLHALGAGVTTLEMDVVFTSDMKVVLSHEPFFNHEISTRPDGSFVTEKEESSLNIFRMTYEEVTRYDVGLKSHPRFPQQKKMKVVKPLLADVLDSVKQYMMMARRPMPFFNIETKTQPLTDQLYHPVPSAFVEGLMTVIREKEVTDFVIIQSFDFRTLQYLHQHYPAVKTAMLIEDYDKRSLEVQLRDLGFTPTIYSPAYQLVTPDLLNKCHALGMKVILWTVNDKAKIGSLKAMGVDGIITDYPDLFEN